MKESIGGMQLFIIVVIIVTLFSGIMALTLNHANAFAVKDQLVQIIEKNEGFDITKECQADKCDYEPLEEIVDSLQSNSYRQTGKCPVYNDKKIKVGSYQRNGIKTTGNNLASFCIIKKKNDGNIKSYYYQVIVFYSLDIPVLNSLFQLKTTGETKKLYS